MSEQDILTAAADLEIGIYSAFIPNFGSRNAGHGKHLNWKVTLSVKERKILTVDYSAGEAHCPSYRQGDRSVARANMVARECEAGLDDASRKPILPKLADVLSSLVSDADVLNHGSFEEWASDLGFDPDSRKSEAVYKACLEVGLKLRAALGESGLAALQEACQDY